MGFRAIPILMVAGSLALAGPAGAGPRTDGAIRGAVIGGAVGALVGGSDGARTGAVTGAIAGNLVSK